MNKTKVIRILCACLISIVSLTGKCYADEHSTNVKYDPEFDEIMPMKVSIAITANTNELGKIYDGEKVLEVGETIYQLKHTETRTFRIRPVIGYDVDKVIYDNEDIALQLIQKRSIQKEYSIVIEGKGHDAKVEITYKKIGADKPEEPSVPDEPDQPTKPEEPSKPDDPSKPSVPDNPNLPDNPSKPNVPDNPNLPNDSGSVEIPTVPGDSAIQNPNSSKSPNTGVISDTNSFGFMISISMVVIIATLLKRKKKDESI